MVAVIVRRGLQLTDYSGGTDNWNVFDVQTVTVAY